MQKISKWIFKITGWKAIVSVPEPSKSVICIAPHTSNYDFLIGKFFYWSINRKSNFLMKKTWFFFPLGILFRSMGGIPVNRSKSSSITDTIAQEFDKHEKFHIAITPEGTRSKVKKWKMGFYYIAVKANVPIQLAFIDYKKKEMGITQIFYPTANEELDIKTIRNFYKDVSPKHFERFHS